MEPVKRRRLSRGIRATLWTGYSFLILALSIIVFSNTTLWTRLILLNAGFQVTP